MSLHFWTKPQSARTKEGNEGGGVLCTIVLMQTQLLFDTKHHKEPSAL